MSSPHCFIDSKVAHFWIKGTDKSWKPFVQNHASEIRDLTPANCWKHCSGRKNPADIPSRGFTSLELSVIALWHNGPEWLQTSDLQDTQVLIPSPDCLVELKQKELNLAHGLLSVERSIGLSKIIRCENFSSLNRLLSVTVMVLRFCRLFHSTIRPEAASDPYDEVCRAEELWILEVQRVLVNDDKFNEL